MLTGFGSGTRFGDRIAIDRERGPIGQVGVAADPESALVMQAMVASPNRLEVTAGTVVGPFALVEQSEIPPRDALEVER